MNEPATADWLVTRFGAAVRRHREQRGWSQEALAARAEINRSYMGEVERGDAVASLAVAAKLAAALGLPLATLISESEGASDVQALTSIGG